MINYFFVFSIVFIYFFFACLPFATDYFFLVLTYKFTRYPEAIHAVLHAVLLVSAEVALGVAQVIDGIQQVGFATAIRPRDAGNGSRKTECRGRIITELG